MFAAPGNPGIAEHATLVALDIADHAAVVAFCATNSISLVVVGPEGPLVAGIADPLRAAGIPVFGPGKAAAQLEGSKGFVKDLCAAHAIPTAAYARHDNREAAIADLPRFGLPVVIKADGLAAGKGVIIAETTDAAADAITHMFGGGFGDAGAEVVIEAFIAGEEVSFFALTDGSAIMPFGSAQDHKRVGDGDVGPNTGGMGAYSPARVLTPELEAEVLRTIITPTVAALAADGMPYCGVLFAGLMLTDTGPQLIEYNCRFGDPECQVLMMRYDGDLAALMLAVAEQRLAEEPAATFTTATALTVVMAARGYPAQPRSGGTIILPAHSDARIFHAGTALHNDVLVASGGRVLTVTASGRSVSDAQSRAYTAIATIDFADGFCRRDIGWREIAREQSPSVP